MLPQIIQELEEMEKKATKGKWFYDGIVYLFTKEEDGNNQMLADDGADGDDTRMRGVGASLPLKDNAKFICLMQNNLPALLAAAKWAVENGYQNV